MLAIKPAVTLLALGLGGLLGTTALPRTASVAPAPAAIVANAVAVAPAAVDAADALPSDALPSGADLAAAVHANAQQRIRADLDDANAIVSLGNLDVQRASGRSLEARATGVVRLAGARAIPVDVVAVYDLADGRLESVDYTAHPVAELGAVDRMVRDAIGRRIGDRIAADFADQPTRFRLLQVERVGYGDHRTRLQGAGLTDFGPEGAVYTPFVAILDKHTGELLQLDYDLVQEGPAPEVASL